MRHSVDFRYCLDCALYYLVLRSERYLRTPYIIHRFANSASCYQLRKCLCSLEAFLFFMDVQIVFSLYSSYSTINSSLGPFYAKVSRKAFLYFRRRMVNALNLCSYLVLIYLVWSIGIYSIQIMMKMVKDEMSLHSFERVNRNPSHSAEKLKVD